MTQAELIACVKNSAIISAPILINFGRIVSTLTAFRSSCPEVFCKKGVLRNFAKFTGKHLCYILIFNKVAGLKMAASESLFLLRVF